ncbi:hypothetical protein CHA_P10094 [Pseudomonas phage CHA_P1]|uniref:Uncharacterized protein n=1 Tax=Pseudomonas phage CHA_P1 TaxID=1327965 RepID=V5JVE6_9CAUD|nr:hypothetical protein X837_gp094 [Pseudomonas phage CHA_P1]AGR89048.1 hypothetical protein CHA_P10094 [Pseudomonas phage CHA_P1]
MRSIKSLAREAYKNRYAFAHVTVARDGNMLGHWAEEGFDPVKLGNIHDCSTTVNPRKTGVCFRNRDFLVFTFGMEVLK